VTPRTWAARRSSRTGPRWDRGRRDPQAGADDIRGRLAAQRPVVVMVAGLPADRPTVVITVNEAARRLGLAAGALVRTAAGILGGGGGGRDDVAQGGGAPLGDNTTQAIDDAFGAVRAVVRDMTRPGSVTGETVLQPYRCADEIRAGGALD